MNCDVLTLNQVMSYKFFMIFIYKSLI